MRTNSRIETLGLSAAAQGRCIVAPDALTARLLNGRARAGKIARPLTGCFAATDYWTSLTPLERYLHLLRTLTICHPQWAACSQSAALAYEFTQSFRLQSVIHMAVPGKRHQPAARPIRLHFPAARHTRIVNGVRVTAPGATILDCIRDLTSADALAICDSAVHLHYLALTDFIQIIGISQGHRGLRHAVALAPFIDGRSENTGESIARMAMLIDGLPPPELQVEFVDRISGRVIRVDFLWRFADGRLVAAELDGRQKYADPAMLRSGDAIDAILREKNRDGNLSLLKIHTVHFSYADIHNGVMLRKLTYAGVPRGRVRSELDW